MAGIFSLLFAHRIAQSRPWRSVAFANAGLAFAVAFATALGEALWYAFSYDAPLIQVLAANLDFSYACGLAGSCLALGSLFILHVWRGLGWQVAKLPLYLAA